RLYPTPVPNTVVVSNGVASMGIALPGAIAAKLVFPERKVIAFCGDGGFLMNVQELETAKRLGTAIVCMVLVDDRLGIIEANERRIFGRAFATEFGNPGFVELARAIGVVRERVGPLERGTRGVVEACRVCHFGIVGEVPVAELLDALVGDAPIDDVLAYVAPACERVRHQRADLVGRRAEPRH